MQSRLHLNQIAISMFFSILFIFLSISFSHASEKKITWQSRDQFVALEKTESIATKKNSHPHDFSKNALTELIASINIKNDDSSKPEPLFTPLAIETIVPELQSAFKIGRGDQDITFAVIGFHKSIIGFAKSPKVTTGRLFLNNEGLNLIVGMAQLDVNEREDRRLNPFVPGSRQSAATGGWQLTSSLQPEFFTMKRNDWIVFKNTELKENLVEQKSAPSSKDSSTKRQTELFQPVKPEQHLNPVERMTILQELKAKGLITEEEFRAKRSRILDTL